MMLSRRFLSSTAIVGAMALPASAQDIPLDPIIVEQRDVQSGAADRATAVYVSDAELERARVGDLKDVFAGIASVSVGGALPVAQKIFVNGIDMLNLSVTIDGVAQNNRAFHHVTANAIDPGLLKQVRVDAGVAAADTGPNALAGAVVMETVDTADILQQEKNFGGNLRLSYSDNGGTWQSALTMAGRQDGFEWLGYIKRATGDDYEDGNGDEVAGSGANLTSYLLKGAFETTEGDRFEFSAQQLDDSEYRPYRANIGSVGRALPTRFYDTTRKNYAFSYENTMDTGMWDPKLTIGWSESVVDIPDPEGSQGTSSSLSGTAQNTFTFSPGNTVVAGLDFYDRMGRYEDIYGTDLEENAQNIGLFAQARLQPIDRLKLSFGARADFEDFEGTSGDEETYDGMSGNMSAAYDVTDELTLRAGYSNVFGGVSIEDNYLFYRIDDYDALRAARAENFMAGFDWARGNLRIGGELFKTQVSNARVEEGNFGFESTGFNLGTTYGWNGGFARLTYSNSEVTVDGDPASSYEGVDFGAPIGEIIAFEVEQRLTPGLTVGGGIDMALDYDHSDSSDPDDSAIPGYTVVNVFAEYVPRAIPAMTVRTGVANLFDQQYSDRATYGVDYADSGFGFIPLREPGRTITLEATMRF
ncbi:TonB-dependent siderophore receptor [Falsirhodobacter sp. alg1]|uniref:TonB-dependent receptor plug domain-containing protein n=1 Tax=Falsirhodobacter sp. alg1 TaxID=1472418 RepID=UPI000786CC3E|nr:TonB-dependent receptor [Falsirhodobacter sp. alg1]